MQRFVWDLHYPRPQAPRYDFPISAVYMDTPRTPLGPAAHPGVYTVKLTAGGRTQTRTLAVKIDPRVKATEAALRRQFELSMQAYEGMNRSFAALGEIRGLRARIKQQREGAKGAQADALAALDQKLAALAEGGAQAAGAAPAPANLAQLNSSFESLLDLLQSADAQPTAQAVTAAADLQRQLAEALSRWGEIKGRDAKTID